MSSTTVHRPKSDRDSRLDAYHAARRIGVEGGDCWDEFPDCPVSIFNIIPDVYTEREQFNVTIDDFGAGTDVVNHLKDVNIDIDVSPK